MIQTKYPIKKRLLLGFTAVLVVLISGCNFPRFFRATDSAEEKPAKTAELAGEVSIQKSPSLQGSIALPTVIAAKKMLQYDGESDGVKYTVQYPADFSHRSIDGWDRFCLSVHENLCVSIQKRSGNWADAKGMADEAMDQVKKDIATLSIYHQQSTTDSDGFPAYWVGSYSTLDGIDYERNNLFILVQHVGFEIVTDGEAQMVEAYRPILKNIVESFAIEYN